MNENIDLNNKKLSIIIPAYNEAGNISKVIAKVCDVVLPYGIRKEIIVVDDGSKDATYDNACRYVSSNANLPVKILRHEQNHGKGRAIRTALAVITGDYVIIQDGDLELDPNDIAKLMKAMIDGNYEVVYGSRSRQTKHEPVSQFLPRRTTRFPYSQHTLRSEHHRRTYMLQAHAHRSVETLQFALRRLRVLPRSNRQNRKTRNQNTRRTHTLLAANLGRRKKTAMDRRNRGCMDTH